MTFAVRFSRASFGAAKARPSRRQRFGEAVGEYTDCLAVLGIVAPLRNFLRSLRSLWSNRRNESDHEARCARGPKPCAPQRLAGALPPARARLCREGVGFRCAKQYGAACRDAVKERNSGHTRRAPTGRKPLFVPMRLNATRYETPASSDRPLTMGRERLVDLTPQMAAIGTS